MAQPSVLLVDNEQRSREVLVEAITRMGFDTRGIGSGEQALRVLSQQPFGIVITELNLPGMGGLELIESIWRENSAVQVVILTAFGDLESAKRAIRLDAVDFLTKPCQRDELETALSRARSRRRLATVRPRGPMEWPVAVGSAVPLEDIERAHILSAMTRHGGNRRTVADELGISLRTLYNRLRDYRNLKYLTSESKIA